jgi:hypothetical protein
MIASVTLYNIYIYIIFPTQRGSAPVAKPKQRKHTPTRRDYPGSLSTTWLLQVLGTHGVAQFKERLKELASHARTGTLSI